MLGFLLVACGGGPAPQTPAEGKETNAASAPAGDEEGASAEGAESAGSGEGSDEKTEASSSTNSDEFKTVDTHTAKDAHGVEASKLAPTKTEALLKLIVVDKVKGPVKGIVVSLQAADGKKFYAPETDATGYTELLVPVGQKYDLVYVGLGQSEIAASTTVENEPRLTMKLTLRFKGLPPTLVLEGVTFDTGKATIRKDSFAQLDKVVEFMTYKKSARIEISGHTDNKGNPKTNQALSQKRAEACRAYLISKGVVGSRIKAVGYGDQRPIAPNDSEEGRERNRRIEAKEL